MKLYGRSLVCFGILGVAGVAEAIDCAPSSKSFTIKTAQDAVDIKTCPTFTGSIVVAADGPDSVSLDGITSILGDIEVEDVAQLHSLSSTTLATVASFTLNNLPQLSSLSFPTLTNFSSLKWSNLPSLTECAVANGTINGEIQDIVIHNTSLHNLDWVKWPVGTQMNISSNTNLKKFDIPYATINGGSSLTLSNNPNLTTIDVSQLTGIYGGLEISGNDRVQKLAFDKLDLIAGFVQMNGEFNNVSMSALDSPRGITGALTVQSTGDITSLCSSLEEKQLTGHYTCTSNHDPASGPSETSGGSPTPSSTANPNDAVPSQDDSVLSPGEMAGVAIACIVSAVLAAIAAFFYFRRRLRAKVQEITQKKDAGFDDSDSSLELGERRSFPKELELDNTQRRDSSLPKELESPRVRLEMMTDNARLELPGRMLAHELEGADERSASASASAGSVGNWSPLVRHELPG